MILYLRRRVTECGKYRGLKTKLMTSNNRLRMRLRLRVPLDQDGQLAARSFIHSGPLQAPGIFPEILN
jgi:hypothetical protein